VRFFRHIYPSYISFFDRGSLILSVAAPELYIIKELYIYIFSPGETLADTGFMIMEPESASFPRRRNFPGFWKTCPVPRTRYGPATPDESGTAEKNKKRAKH